MPVRNVDDGGHWMITTCPCGSGDWEKQAIAAAASLQRCRACGLLVPLERRDGRDLLAWYETDYWKKYCEEQTGTDRDNLYAHVLAWLDRVSPRRGAVLDVGCGGGRFLSLCQAKGWKTIGIEPSRAAVVHARRRGLEVRRQAWPAPAIADESVEAVTFINVLDHLPDPFEALREAARVLKPNGLLYLRVPNAPVHARLKQLLARLGLENVAVVHLYGFGRRTFSVLLPRMGFAPIAVRTAPPSQGYAYQKSSAFRTWGYRLLKFVDLASYRTSAFLGLDRLGWGLSLEVLARKTPVAPGAQP
jgi:SAM-dependent methyltransferase